MNASSGGGRLRLAGGLFASLAAPAAMAAAGAEGPALAGIPIDFILFGAILGAWR